MAFFDLTTGADRIMYVLTQYGVTDVALPFLLIFTIIFSVLQRVKMFGEDKKNIHVVLALMFALLSIIPHVTGGYSRYGYDPIDIINTLIPSAAVLSIAIILLLFLFGIFGSEFSRQGTPGWAMILILAVMLYIFGTTVGWWYSPSDIFGTWWDQDLTTIVVIILVFALIVYWITSKEDEPTFFSKALEFLGKRHK